MRNAAELRAAARATGTYDDYIGDGASVPWDSPLFFPYNAALYVFKLYLDEGWPETFRLHDWTYTPLGALINVTREEADHVILEEMSPRDPISARIVYEACRLGGGPNFGVSMTGYRVPAPVVENPPKQAQYGRISTMAIKVVMIFEAVTGGGPLTGQRQRIAGWTESLWWPSDDAAALRNAMEVGIPGTQCMLQSRAFLLPPSASIQGYRFHVVGSNGRAQLRQVVYPGAYAGTTQDLPTVSALCTGFNSTSGKIRRWTIRGLPDEICVNGELVPWFMSTPEWTRYADAMAVFAFRVSALTTLTGQNVFVTDAGVVTLTGASPFANGTQVQLRGARGPANQPISYDGVIVGVGPANTQFTVNNWANQIGVQAVGGTFTAKVDGYVTFDAGTIEAVKAVSRKVGRPFDLFRGRRSVART